MITGRNIIMLSSTAWDFLWEGNHEIASRFARAGNRVFYIEHMGFRSPGLRKIGRVASYARRWAQAARSLGVREVERGLYICTPFVLPPYGSGMQSLLNRRFFLPVIDKARRNLGFTDPIILNYAPTDSAASLIALLRSPRSTLVALYTDDYEQAIGEERLRQTEVALLRQSDLVLAQEEALAARCRKHHDNVHLVTHGVDASLFRAEAEEIPELKSLPRPVIGYVGGLHHGVDYSLLEAMIHRRPDWSWVFVGAKRHSDARLPASSNVHAFGWRTHSGINRFMQAFDVCIIPYREDAVTRAVFPTKLYEYLAAGRPVVTTRMPAVVALHERHPLFQLAPADPEQFIAAIESTLRLSDDPETVRLRRALAQQNDWTVRMEEISALIEGADPNGPGKRPGPSAGG